MRKSLVFLAFLVAGAAWGQAPAYTASSIVNAADYTAGPFAPNSVVALFGSNLAWSARTLMAGDIANNSLPMTLGGVSVYVDNSPAPLLYVSPSQINFIVPANQVTGDWAVRVVREGVSGPEVFVTLVDAAPALFASAGYAIATHIDGSLLGTDSPAYGGDTVVVYATGLGKTLPNPAPGELPLTAAPIVAMELCTVYLNGAEVDPVHIKYVGITPFSGGLYQINLQLPAGSDPDPEIRVTVAGRQSLAGLKLYVQPGLPAGQPEL
jgi:uncharacterized protein (TIGR03437 family)